MLFAAIDYWQYTIRPGRFGNLGLWSPMKRSFRGTLPETLVNDLQPGDIIFVQTLRSFFSWLIMYLTKSEISHVASYAGDHIIVHATSGGVVRESIESLYGDNTMLVPCSFRVTPEQRERLENSYRKLDGAPYSWRSVFIKGIRILVGREPMYFRVTFFVDSAIVIMPVGVALAGSIGFRGGLIILATYATIVGASIIWSQLVSLPLNKNTAKPVEVFLVALDLEGDFYLNPKIDTDV